MRPSNWITLASLAITVLISNVAQAYTLPEISAQTTACIECHKAEADDPDVLDHYSINISVIVSPKDCAKCHEGRRARHGVSMMGPDITHWHGTYEVAKTFYTELLPELEELAEKAMHSQDAEKQAHGVALSDAIDVVLHSDKHKWYINEMDPAEAEERAKRKEEFKARYSE